MGSPQRKHLSAYSHQGTKPPRRVPALTVAALSRYRPPCCLIFIKSISAASVAVALQHSCPLTKSILIDHNWLSQTHIDPVQTHAQGPLKTHSPRKSLTNEAPPHPGRFIRKILFDLLAIEKWLFPLKPIKADVCYRVPTLWDMSLRYYFYHLKRWSSLGCWGWRPFVCFVWTFIH